MGRTRDKLFPPCCEKPPHVIKSAKTIQQELIELKLKKLLPVLLLILVLIYAFLPDAGNDDATIAVIDGNDSVVETVINNVAADIEDKTDSTEGVELEAVLDPDGYYYSKEDVALYIHTYGCLPQNFVTKSEAEDAGWSGGSVEKYIPGAAIGGNRFGNREGLLPDAPGRSWTECDINTNGASGRGAERIVFSNDGLIYYTSDHYESFELLYD